MRRLPYRQVFKLADMRDEVISDFGQRNVADEKLFLFNKVKKQIQWTFENSSFDDEWHVLAESSGGALKTGDTAFMVVHVQTKKF